MHLQLAPDAPFLLRAAADSVLVLHIGGGAVGLASGALALAARKGGRIHRLAGKVFLGSMLISMVIGAVVSPMIGQPANAIGGVLSIYLVVTAWLTVRRPAGQIGRAEISALIVPLTATPLMLAAGWIGAHSPSGEIDGVPYQAPYVMAALSALLVALDVRAMLRRQTSGASRLARHLWRMCVALFFASASLFIGQPKVFPEPLRGSPILWILAFAPLALMVFWLIRVRRLDPRTPARSRPRTSGPATPEAI